MFANVLIVCHANVCRSPAAEWLFRSRQHERGAQPIAFRSAGLRAIDGHAMDPVMRRLLEERVGAREARQHVDDVLLGVIVERELLLRGRAVQRVAKELRKAGHLQDCAV